MKKKVSDGSLEKTNEDDATMVATEQILSNLSIVLAGLFMLVFVLVRKELTLALTRKFFRGKGWVTIRMYMPDRQEVEAFVNLNKNPTLNFFGRSFVFDAEKATFKSEDTPEEKASVTESKVTQFGKSIANKVSKKPADPAKLGGLKEFTLSPDKFTISGKFPVYSYVWDNAEPLDPYNLTKKTDSSLLSAAVLRAKAQGAINELLGQNKKLMLFVMVIAGAAAAAAYFGYQNSTLLEAIAQRGTALG